METFLLRNKHYLRIVAKRDERLDKPHYAVLEYNEYGTFVGVAFTDWNRDACERWIERAKARGYGYAPTI